MSSPSLPLGHREASELRQFCGSGVAGQDGTTCSCLSVRPMLCPVVVLEAGMSKRVLVPEELQSVSLSYSDHLPGDCGLHACVLQCWCWSGLSSSDPRLCSLPFFLFSLSGLPTQLCWIQSSVSPLLPQEASLTVTYRGPPCPQVTMGILIFQKLVA